MKFLVAIALLALVVAEAHHTPQHTLRGPRFKPGKLYKYDVEFNVTSGVLGMSSQVSKAALKAEVSIYAKSEKEHILKITNVYTSGSLKAVDSKYSYIPMRPNSELEERLAVPIKFTLESGEVASYTLSPRENLESKKIKKSILRSLEMYVPENEMRKMESDSEINIPIMYNITKDTDFGEHTINYMIIVSPYPDFPADTEVYNITRSDNFEAERYPAYHIHHNFHKQGCPEVCRQDWESNKYGAGCPVGHEPHHSPIKMSFNHEHHLSQENNIMNPEIIRTVETHVAQMYDQDMEVLILYEMRRKTISEGSIVEPSGQQSYTDLKDMESEISEQEFDEYCQYESSSQSETNAKELLTEISQIIERGDLEDEKSSLIGQKIILLKYALRRLSVPSLAKVAEEIDTPDHMTDPEKKIKRQIWLDILPLIGSEESITYITQYLKENLDSNRILVWEAKEILEALPQNIRRPSEKNIRELRSLIREEQGNRKVKNNHLLHSAAHLALARVIGSMCGSDVVDRSQSTMKSSWFSYPRVMNSLQDDSDKEYGPVKCPEGLVDEIIQEIRQKLERCEKKEDIAVYLETLAHIGDDDVLPVIAKYAYGTAENIQQFSPSYIDFVKTVSIYALHNVVGKLPEEVIQIVLPVFFNVTENPKVRNAAFGVIIRCQPSLEVLQHVAIRSWFEKSTEVGSYVTSTLESFGNSSLPCMHLTSHRIKKVLPQLKRFDIGIHHSKNLLWSYFDDVRALGLEARCEYSPSNESIIPSALYKSISYSTDSLRDVLMQMALNIQGLTQEKIVKTVERFFELTPLNTLDERREKQIFGDAILRENIPDDLRFTFYKRLFYCSSYNYFEGESLLSSLLSFKEFVEKYLGLDGQYKGHIVKIFMPATYHTVIISRTLAQPVEFEMRQPLVFALKAESLKRGKPTMRDFHYHFRPSFYFTKLFTNQFKNYDCKEVGVYHEHKLAISYPFELKLEGISFPNVTIKYKVPELKKVFTYFSEAGTYAGKKQLRTLPSSSEREPITTQPSPFKIQEDLNVVGVPPLRLEVDTEDIHQTIVWTPETPTEALEVILRNALNSGWRHTSVNITLQEDSRIWPRDTEVTFSIQYYRDYITTKLMNRPHSSQSYANERQESQSDDKWSSNSQWESPQEESPSSWNVEESQGQWPGSWPPQKPLRNHPGSEQWFWTKSQEKEDWEKYLKPSDISSNKNPNTFIEQGRRAYWLLNTRPHIRHVWKVEVETLPVNSKAFFKMEYNHTYSKSALSVRIDAAVKRGREQSYEAYLDHFAAFYNKPNEFRYDTHKENQAGVYITSFGLPRGSVPRPWEKTEVVFKGLLNYQSLESVFYNDLLPRLRPEDYYPERHEQCLSDIQEGKALSTDCVQALRERSIYNHLDMAVLWQQTLPEDFKTFVQRTDLYLKHFFFHYLNITDERRGHPNVIRVWLNHIDKFVDEPVFDYKIQTPEETIEYKRVPSGGFFFEPFSSIYTVVENAALSATNNSYLPTCAWMKDYVNTYDMKTYKYYIDECNYVLSSHCAENKYFAITAKGLDRSRRTKEIRIYISDAILVLTPKSGRQWKVEFNGREQIIEHPELLDGTNEIYVYEDETDGESLLQVVAERAGIRVTYDGINVKVQIDPRYKGELCGLCSEFDGEELREYRGVDKCLYSHPFDFARSAITKYDGRCAKKALQGEKMCDDDEENDDISTRGYSKDDEYIPTIRRNVVQSKGSDYCFSLLPVPVCENYASPSMTEPQVMAFHCLPKRDVTARRLVTEAKRRVLGEIAYKSSDYEETIQVAKMC